MGQKINLNRIREAEKSRRARYLATYDPEAAALAKLERLGKVLNKNKKRKPPIYFDGAYNSKKED